jgi:hypothetical protein
MAIKVINSNILIRFIWNKTDSKEFRQASQIKFKIT